jgi:tRNA(fMet)-specific endonuclease VapC
MPLTFMLDTNIVSMLMRAPEGPLQRRIRSAGESSVCASIVTTAELHFGAALKPSAKGLANFEMILRGLQVMALEPPVDQIYGRLRAELHRTGRPIGPNDTWIAAHALTLDLTLVTANVREFSRVPDLRVENWLD